MIKEKFPPPSIWLSINDCRRSYEELVRELNGQSFSKWEARFEGRLESIVESVRQEVYGQYLYPTVETAAAAYFVLLIKSHPFKDGNKRSAVLFTLQFLGLNGLTLGLTFKELYSLAIMVASEKELTFDELKLGVTEVISTNIKKQQFDIRELLASLIKW